MLVDNTLLRRCRRSRRRRTMAILRQSHASDPTVHRLETGGRSAQQKVGMSSASTNDAATARGAPCPELQLLLRLRAERGLPVPCNFPGIVEPYKQDLLTHTAGVLPVVPERKRKRPASPPPRAAHTRRSCAPLSGPTAREETAR